MKAPCSHCEQTKIRGSVADVAPMWPQFGQMIRVSVSVASAGAGARQEQVRNFPQPERMPSPDRQPDASVEISFTKINDLLLGEYRAAARPHQDAIIEERCECGVRGVIGV
jgi:hypothetical protein